MAKTFDLNDPEQRQAYLEESAFQWLMYGENWMTLNQADQTITIWDQDELPPAKVVVDE